MKYKKVYFVGIKGVGMANLAVVLLQSGVPVAGCDVEDIFITDGELNNAHIPVDIGFDPQFLSQFIGKIDPSEVLVITTAAHGGMENPIVQSAEEQKINVLTYAQALGKAMSGELFDRTDIKGISVAGAHGKTSVSAMLACYLNLLGYDPSYVVGTASILPIGDAGRYGKGKYFVAEADEYASDLKSDPVSKFFYQHPRFLIINNIDFDHPDFFHSIDDVVLSFGKLIDQIPQSGIIFINGDDTRLNELVSKSSHTNICRYGVNSENDYIIRDFKEFGLSSTFKIETKEMELGEFSLSVPGYHNAKNVLPVVAFLIEIGVSIQKIAEVLPRFLGTKRRIEKIGETSSGSLLFDDYAHHPKEIKTTLTAMKAAFPTKKIVVVFQPHMFSRTKAMVPEFVGSFESADEIIIMPTYASAREEMGDLKVLENEMKHQFELISRKAHFLENSDSVIQYLRENIHGSEHIIMTMGAGDVYKIEEQLTQNHDL